MPAAAQQNLLLPVALHLDGRSHQLSNQLIRQNGVTFAPFRDIFTALGATVGYTAKYGRLLVWAELGKERFLLENGSTAFYHNDVLLSLPETPFVKAGVFYFPLRFLLDQAGYQLYLQTLPWGNTIGSSVDNGVGGGSGNSGQVMPGGKVGNSSNNGVNGSIWGNENSSNSIAGDNNWNGESSRAGGDSGQGKNGGNLASRAGENGGNGINNGTDKAGGNDPNSQNSSLVKTDIFLYRTSPRLEETGPGTEEPAENGVATENNSATDAKATLPTRFNPAAQKIPVLMYHHLVPKEECTGDNGSIISVEAFAAQLAYLFANGYRTVTLSDLLLFIKGQKELPPRCIVLTFDDGYASNYEYAYPLLQQYCFRAVQFPLTGKVAFWTPRMTEEMMEASRDVFEFHSHSHNLHRYVDGKQALLALDPDAVREDLLLSRKLLDCFAFAYPYGAYNKESIEILKKTGYKMAFTIIPGPVCPGDDPFRLKRLGVYPETTLKDFARLLENYHW